MADWSARSVPSPAAPEADAIWVAEATPTSRPAPVYRRTRASAMAWLEDRIAAALDAGERVLAGFDFPFGYPQGFASGVVGRPDPFAVWSHLAGQIDDGDDNANNRFEVAARLNACFPGVGPFWGRPAAQTHPGLPDKGRLRIGHGLPERRAVEDLVRSAHPCWKLYTTGSVGSQALLGLARLDALRARFAGRCAVWPFEPPDDAPLVLAEIYPGLIDAEVKAVRAGDPASIKDAVQVTLCAGAVLEAQTAGTLARMLQAVPDGPARREEGWILGAGHETDLRAAARAAAQPDLTPPRLANDCFALPQGVTWTPVETALRDLSSRLRPVTAVHTVALGQAAGRVLARDVHAARSNPPAANSAVDGYAFDAAATGRGRQVLPLVAGRAAAGGPYAGPVPAGHALRILTGALVPEGVDTVVLEEDVTESGGHIAFDGPIKPGANTRRAGEDVVAGALVLSAGRTLAAPDLALLAAVGCAEVPVRRRLRVGVLSTGDELAAPGSAPEDPSRTYDANRPMLLAMAARWGHIAVDLGHCGDDRDALRARFDDSAASCDAVLTSGGASAGDEDHVSALLRDNAALAQWRIAIKPGRPLALGNWNGCPIFGLPGNPVAAFVCTLLFARPALCRLAGGDWPVPQAMTVPAAFAKRKKAGRREYLRARLTDAGQAEVFMSEGSGRISGLSWATGLVELADAARDIAPGDPVRYLPFGSFGL